MHKTYFLIYANLLSGPTRDPRIEILEKVNAGLEKLESGPTRDPRIEMPFLRVRRIAAAVSGPTRDPRIEIHTKVVGVTFKNDVGSHTGPAD